jgi:hypothetical protein
MRTAPGHVLSLRGCAHTVFDGLTLEYGANGFAGNATPHITIRNCVLRSLGQQGALGLGEHCVIEHNLFQKIGACKFQHGIYNGRPGLIVRHNVFEEITGAAIHQYGSPAGGGCQFYGNVFRRPWRVDGRPGPDGQPRYYVDIIAWGEGSNLICNNVFYGEGKRGGISLNSPDNRISNNTFVGSTYAASFHSGKPGNQVMNNIVQDAARSFAIWPASSLPQTLDHNLYYSTTGNPQWQRDGVTYQTFSDYQRAAGEAHSLYADPALAGPADARLKPGSPAIGAGAALREMTVDFDGLPRPQGAACDIGAYEMRAR